jgi:hypothetical protein
MNYLANISHLFGINYMEQYSTKEQWDELSDEEKKIVFLKFYTEDLFNELCHKKGQEPELFLSIGQMIEFIGGDLIQINYDGLEYDVVIDIGDSECNAIGFNKKELKDSLWKACRYKLRK